MSESSPFKKKHLESEIINEPSLNEKEFDFFNTDLDNFSDNLFNYINETPVEKLNEKHDPFEFLMSFEEALHKKVGEKETNIISTEYSKARKDFVLDFVNYCDEKYVEDNDPKKEKYRELINKSTTIFTGVSTTIFDYLGGVGADMDVLVKLKSVPELDDFYISKMMGTVYDVEGADQSYLEKSFDDKNVLDKIHATQVLSDLVYTALGQGYPSKLYQKVTNTLEKQKGVNVLMDHVIDSKLHEINFMCANDMPINFSRDSYSFKKNESLSQKVKLPEKYSGYYPFLMSKDFIGLKDQYGVVRYETRTDGAQVASYVKNRDQIVLEDIARAQADHILESKILEYVETEFFDNEDIKKDLMNGKDAASILKEGFLDIDKLEGIVLKEDDIVEFSNKRVDRDTDLLSEMHNDTIKDLLESKLKVDLAELSIESQEKLLQYMLSINSPNSFSLVAEKSSRIDNSADRINFLKSFLSLEQGGDEMGEKILSIGDKYNKSDAAEIFAKYAQIVDTIDDVDSYLKAEFEDVDLETKQQVSEQLLVKGKKLLENFATADNADMEIMLRQLETIKSENIILVESFKALRKDNLISSIEDMNDIQTESLSGEDILSNENLLSKVTELYRKNYLDYSSEGRESLINNMLERLKLSDTKVRILSKGEKLLSFVILSENPKEESVYISGLNIEKGLEETSAGKVVLEKTLQEYENKKWIINAEASPDNAQHYINKFGFVGTETSPDSDEDYVLNITKNPGHYFETKDRKKYSKSEIIKMVEANLQPEDKIAVFVTRDSRESPPHLDDGYVITQMFRGILEDKKGNYFLLEKESEKKL